MANIANTANMAYMADRADMADMADMDDISILHDAILLELGLGPTTTTVDDITPPNPSTTYCPARALRARTPTPFTILDDSLSPATHHRHARHQALFHDRLAAFTHTSELNFLALITEWAAGLARAAPSPTTGSHTHTDFTAFHAVARRAGRLHPPDVARLARMLRTLDVTAPLVLGSAERARTCALFARVLCAGEDGTGRRSGKGGGAAARGLREWRRQWADVLFVAMGREAYGLVMKHAEWTTLCMREVMGEWMDGIEEGDCAAMYEWGMDELLGADRLALLVDGPPSKL